MDTSPNMDLMLMQGNRVGVIVISQALLHRAGAPGGVKHPLEDDQQGVTNRFDQRPVVLGYQGDEEEVVGLLFHTGCHGAVFLCILGRSGHVGEHNGQRTYVTAGLIRGAIRLVTRINSVEALCEGIGWSVLGICRHILLRLRRQCLLADLLYGCSLTHVVPLQLPFLSRVQIGKALGRENDVHP